MLLPLKVVNLKSINCVILVRARERGYVCVSACLCRSRCNSYRAHALFTQYSTIYLPTVLHVTFPSSSLSNPSLLPLSILYHPPCPSLYLSARLPRYISLPLYFFDRQKGWRYVVESLT